MPFGPRTASRIGGARRADGRGLRAPGTHGIVRGITAPAPSPLPTALASLGLPAELVAALEAVGERGTPEPRLAVEDVGVACVGAALLAAARLAEARTGEWLAPALDRGQARAALVSERLFRVDGKPAGVSFAPASRFWRAADGWVRTHANYPWHREALLRAVGAADDDALAAAIASRAAEEVEEAAFAAGGIAAKVRTTAEWREHPQGAAVAAEPLVDRIRLGEAPPRCSLVRHSRSSAHRKPAAGVRVLDFTRVIAGPVCARYLGALGADVLRLDPPDLPDFEPGQPGDTLLGKRSAFLDLGGQLGARRLDALLADADVVLLGYRPGALARFGLVPEELAARHPGLVVMELAAWGHTGPWRERRGFDSIVQAASGIAAIEAGPDREPGALPCQLLDHGTGYLAAAAVIAAMVEQREDGGSRLARLSLARTAHWLLGEGAADGAAGRPAWHEDGAAFARPVDDDRSLTAVPPPGSLGGAPLVWRGPAARYGAAAPAWLDPAG
jgi:crotonobetainyl-CoA:carnitine CoA-transferase CaiB-like acyl-CoA transferase